MMVIVCFPHKGLSGLISYYILIFLNFEDEMCALDLV